MRNNVSRVNLVRSIIGRRRRGRSIEFHYSRPERAGSPGKDVGRLGQFALIALRAANETSAVRLRGRTWLGR